MLIQSAIKLNYFSCRWVGESVGGRLGNGFDRIYGKQGGGGTTYPCKYLLLSMSYGARVRGWSIVIFRSASSSIDPVGEKKKKSFK